jgi:hypothetical protein
MIEQEAAELRRDFPQLEVLPVTADICKPFELPEEAKGAPARSVFSRINHPAISSRTRRRLSCEMLRIFWDLAPRLLSVSIDQVARCAQCCL